MSCQRPLSKALLLCSALCLLPSLAQAKDTMAEETVADQALGTTQIDDIVVTASSRAQRVDQAPATISLITQEQLQTRAYNDLFDAVRDIEGVSVSGGSNFQDILMRGLPGSYTLMLVDGRRVSTRDSRTNGTGGIDQGFTPPAAAIDRIEVVRGPMSSLYGSDAIGGVINVITKKVPEQWGGSVSADYLFQENRDSGDAGQTQFFVGGPLIKDRLGLQVWGKYYDRAEDDIYTAPQGFGAMASQQYVISGRLAWTPTPDHEVMLQADSQRIDRRSHAGVSTPPNVVDARQDHNRDAVSLAWNGYWNWGSSALSVLHEVSDREVFARNRTSLRMDRNPRAPQLTNTVYDAVFNVPLKGSRLGDHNLVFGGQYIQNQLEDINPGARDNVVRQFDIWQRALFVENEWSITDDLALTLGVRLDDHERYAEQWSPRAYLVWNPTDSLTLKGGVSTGFRAPELRAVIDGYAYATGGANCNYGGGACGVIIGDPDLKPESSVNYEVSALWRPTPALSLNATAFRTEFRDKIESDRVCGPDTNGNGACDMAEVQRWSVDPLYQLYYWYNVSDATIQGVELAGTWKATPALTLKAGYTFTDSTQEGGLYDGLPLARTPEHMGNLRLDYAATDRLNLWTSANYHGEELNAGLRVGTNGEPVMDGNAQKGRRYPAYTLVDMGANWRVRDDLTLKFVVYNLADEVQDAATYDFQGDGRRYWLGATVNF